MPHILEAVVAIFTIYPDSVKPGREARDQLFLLGRMLDEIGGIGHQEEVKFVRSKFIIDFMAAEYAIQHGECLSVESLYFSVFLL